MRFFKIQYPKILGLMATTIIAYYLFQTPEFYNFISSLNGLSYLGVFLGGMLFAFGFSAPFAIGFFIALTPQNIFIAAIVAGFGAVISDLLIFRFIRFSFEDEFSHLRNTKTLRGLRYLIDASYFRKIKVYLMYAFAGILIASPLPDEVGVTMFAGLTKVKEFWIALIGFSLNTLGILLILLI